MYGNSTSSWLALPCTSWFIASRIARDPPRVVRDFADLKARVQMTLCFSIEPCASMRAG